MTDEERLRVEALEIRLEALEQHIMRFGPKVPRTDTDVPGCPSWSEPYRPPALTVIGEH